jgi:hypothetical protein
MLRLAGLLFCIAIVGAALTELITGSGTWTVTW